MKPDIRYAEQIGWLQLLRYAVLIRCSIDIMQKVSRISIILFISICYQIKNSILSY